jgi:hypothetical protein
MNKLMDGCMHAWLNG